MTDRKRVYTGYGSLRCDFCSSPDVKWDYPAEDFMVKMPKDAPADWGSEGGFAACDLCHDLIEKDDRNGLLDRSVKTFVEMYGGIAEPELRVGISKVHDGFWRSRKGAARAFG